MFAFLKQKTGIHRLKGQVGTKWWYIIFLVILTIFPVYYICFFDNINSTGKETVLYINTNTNYEKVKNTLLEKSILVNENTFEILAWLIGFPEHIRPGRYVLEDGMGNLRLLYKLYTGRQDPVKLRFQSVRSPELLFKKFEAQLELKSEVLDSLIQKGSWLDSLGLTREQLLCAFIPNTYEINWNITPEAFLDRMKREYRLFWDSARKAKAKALNLTPAEATILASIVEAETYRDSEKPTIAGVYLNRLRTGMKLQADPTVIFALKQFDLTRVLYKHLSVDSPYNTYRVYGLPPGPINCPSPVTIDAVLNPETHDYFYFCAKNDFTGYHIFSKTYEEHMEIARQYAAALGAIQ